MALDKRTSAMLELTFASTFWGFGFIAAAWALRAMGPLAVTGWRFFLAASVGSFFLFVIRREKFEKDQFWLAAVPGLLLSATLILQTWGLLYTTATKSGFITTLYVLMVPVAERFFLKRSLPRFHILYVVLALTGVALICELYSTLFSTPKLAAEGLSLTEIEKLKLNIGDGLTLACAIAATFHILWFGWIGSKIRSSFAFNNYQSVWAGVFPLLLSFGLEPWPQPAWADGSLFGLCILAFGSTLIAFTLQVRAQKHISPSVASLLFLLESPFAALFAIAFLNEGLQPLQWMGGGLILLAALLSTLFATEVAESQ